MNPTDFFDHISLAHDGIWRPQSIAKVSYPESGLNQLAPIEEHSFWFQHRRRCVMDLIETFRPQTPIVDIGGGNGFMTVQLQSRDGAAVLVEPNLSGVLVAKSRGIKHIVQASFADLEIRNLSLPSVGLFDVLEHVEKDDEYLRLLWTKMSPAALLFITVPALEALWAPVDDYSGHFRRYSRRQLVDTLKKAGFSVEYSSYFFSILVPMVFALRTIPGWFTKTPERNDDKNTFEHASRFGKLRTALVSALGWERFCLRKKWSIPIGTSCVAVARRGSY